MREDFKVGPIYPESICRGETEILFITAKRSADGNINLQIIK